MYLFWCLVLLYAFCSAEPVTWLRSDEELLVFNYGDVKPSLKIAAFDFDNTIAFAKSWQMRNSTWSPVGAEKPCHSVEYDFPGTQHVDWWGYYEWSFTFPDVPRILRNYWDQGYKVVIMSNQYVLSEQYDNVYDDPVPVKRATWIRKMIEVCGNISEMAGEIVPLQVIGSLQQDVYEKPCPGMWQVMASFNSPHVQHFCNESFFVGDAAGRIRSTTTSENGADFAATDYQFARAAGVTHYVPEQIFIGMPYPKPEDLNLCLREPLHATCGEAGPRPWCVETSRKRRYRPPT
jgi:bifunctional polynucleotide phosphatase/kinase